MHGVLFCRELVALTFFLAMLTCAATGADFPPPDKLAASAAFPDPLVLFDGTKVTTKEQWETKRKPELKALFQHYMYGRLPPTPKVQKHNILFVDDQAFGGKAKLGEVKLTFEAPTLDHAIHVLFVVPKTSASQKPPIFVGMNFCGNHALLDDPRIHLPEGWVRSSCVGAVNERATDKGRGSQKDVWNVDLILDRGYGLACFYSGDVDPDTADKADGIGPAFYKSGQTTEAPDDAGTIMLWAWGFHRVVDFVQQAGANDVDTSRIAVVGHSRNGKTALLAGALDERIAMVIPLQAGCGGTAPSRTSDMRAESVKRINTSFPHWFCGNFKLFNEQTDRLPFDQHCLIALCAPRPVLLPNAEEDVWANPSGQFELLQAASPVYRLLGAEGLAEGGKPEMNKLIDSRLGYYIRPGKHSMTRPDWEVFLMYADKYLKQ
jgi:(4-O-methyl)-D-glucuronate---lignin esterase